MIDFENGFVKLRQIDPDKAHTIFDDLLILGEEIINAYKGIRDLVVFTNKRVIAVNSQGLTGKKKDFTSLPYSKIQVFSIETSGHFDIDCELELYYSGAGLIRFEFTGQCDITDIGRTIAEYVL